MRKVTHARPHARTHTLLLLSRLRRGRRRLGRNHASRCLRSEEACPARITRHHLRPCARQPTPATPRWQSPRGRSEALPLQASAPMPRVPAAEAQVRDGQPQSGRCHRAQGPSPGSQRRRWRRGRRWRQRRRWRRQPAPLARRRRAPRPALARQSLEPGGPGPGPESHPRLRVERVRRRQPAPALPLLWARPLPQGTATAGVPRPRPPVLGTGCRWTRGEPQGHLGQRSPRLKGGAWPG
mmetsp:Transcript_3744/g.15581  ORF Transcript_3744/g.15581 Transcript_3744/m.15581 type:complete len:239 (+) Transcript_3744:1499-2215(+)